MTTFNSKIITLVLSSIIAIKSVAQIETDSSTAIQQNTEINKDSSIFELSLEDLLNIEVTIGSNTSAKKSNIPVSLSTISEEDIQRSGARNLYDLIEIYVPGATWLTHGEGPKLGMRGIISDRNNKFILRLNGVLMNQKAHVGMVSELENWDLNDIFKIDIIRGPGSVTYGPGAIGGIIDITTKDADNSEGTKLYTNFVSKYNSKGTAISHSFKTDKFKIYAYGSIQQTQGYAPEAYIVNSSYKSGYVGKDFGANTAPVNTYFADFKEIPQYKAHIQGSVANGWNFFVRYTSSGSTLGGNSSQVKFQEGFLPLIPNTDPTKLPTGGGALLSTNFENGSQADNKHFTSSIYKLFEINKKLNITTRASYDNETQARFRGTSTYKYDTKLSEADNNRNLSYASRENLRQWNHRFSEKEISLELLTNYKLNNFIEIALGSTYCYNSWGARWGEDQSKFRMGETNSAGGIPTNILNDTTSEAFGIGATSSNRNLGLVAKKDAIFVGNGWNTSTISFYGDLKFDIHKYLKVLLSGRYDKDTYSRQLFSPRIALVSELNERNVLKLITQQSFRMNTATQLFLQNLSKTSSAPEKLQGVELIFNRIQNKNLNINLSSYYNQIDLLGWNSAKAQVENLGVHKLIGSELEVLFKANKLMIGFSHAFNSQIDWKLNDSIRAAGASYSDYRQTLTYSDDNNVQQSVTLRSTGNSLNNLSTNVTKLYTNYSLSSKIILHFDTRVFWDFNGGKDGLKMLENAANELPSTSSAQKNRMMSTINDAKNRNAYETDIRTNISITYKPISKLEIILYCMNVTNFNNNKRYNLDAGNIQLYPSRLAYVVEPRAYGIKIKYNL